MTSPIDRITAILSAIEAREKLASPGPWRADRYRNPDENEKDSAEYDDWDSWGWKTSESEKFDELAWITDGGCQGYGLSKNDAEFCSSARTDIPRLRKALSYAIKKLSQLTNDPPREFKFKHSDVFVNYETFSKLALMEIEILLEGKAEAE